MSHSCSLIRNPFTDLQMEERNGSLSSVHESTNHISLRLLPAVQGVRLSHCTGLVTQPLYRCTSQPLHRAGDSATVQVYVSAGARYVWWGDFEMETEAHRGDGGGGGGGGGYETLDCDPGSSPTMHNLDLSFSSRSTQPCRHQWIPCDQLLVSSPPKNTMVSLLQISATIITRVSLLIGLSQLNQKHLGSYWVRTPFNERFAPECGPKCQVLLLHR